MTTHKKVVYPISMTDPNGTTLMSYIKGDYHDIYMLKEGLEKAPVTMDDIVIADGESI